MSLIKYGNFSRIIQSGVIFCLKVFYYAKNNFINKKMKPKKLSFLKIIWKNNLEVSKIKIIIRVIKI